MYVAQIFITVMSFILNLDRLYKRVAGVYLHDLTFGSVKIYSKPLQNTYVLDKRTFTFLNKILLFFFFLFSYLFSNQFYCSS